MTQARARVPERLSFVSHFEGDHVFAAHSEGTSMERGAFGIFWSMWQRDWCSGGGTRARKREATIPDRDFFDLFNTEGADSTGGFSFSHRRPYVSGNSTGSWKKMAGTQISLKWLSFGWAPCWCASARWDVANVRSRCILHSRASQSLIGDAPIPPLAAQQKQSRASLVLACSSPRRRFCKHYHI